MNGHFNNLLGELRKSGLVEGWSITDAGIAMIPDSVEPKPVGHELQQWTRAKLTMPENKVFDVLVIAGGDRISVSDLAESAGYTVNGHFNNVLGKLRKLQIAEGTAREGIRANPIVVLQRK